MADPESHTIKKEPVSPVDTAWLRMDSDTNLMMIGSVMIFDRPINIEDLKQVLQERFLRFERFRQKVVIEDDKAYWQDDPHFNIDNHVHSIGLPNPRNKEQLQKLAGDLNSTPLDHNHPLWTMHLVDEYEEGCAIITRMHHCIADGIALVRVMLSITDKGEPETESKDEPHAEHAEPDFMQRITAPVAEFFRHSIETGHEMLDESLDLVRHPSHLVELAKKGLAIGSELTEIGLLPKDPKSCLKNPLTGRKQVAWAPPLSLSDVKSCAHTLNGTVNDVLLACAAGALRRYMLENDKTITGDTIHAAVPFNLRPLDQPITQLGNEFGLVVVQLPVGISDPRERYERVRAEMNKLKKSYQAQVFYGLLGFLGKGPSVLEKTALELLSQKASIVMTNVPGPQTPLFLAGARLLQPMVWVPQSGQVGVGLSILSYDGCVFFGLVADKAMIERPDTAIDNFVKSFNEIQSLTRQ